MNNSYRAQANLQLMLAQKLLDLVQQRELAENWGGYFDQTVLESALFRLQLAYRCHLADLLASRNVPATSFDTARQVVELVPQGTVIPELEELADREQYEPWLELLQSYRYIGPPVARQPAVQHSDLLAVSDISDNRLTSEQLENTRQALSVLIQRHRDTMQEY